MGARAVFPCRRRVPLGPSKTFIYPSTQCAHLLCCLPIFPLPRSGIVLLHNEPPEARKPGQRWRLYVFKDGQPHGEPLHIHRQSRYLFGRERRVADVPTDHPSCSKQHAVLQFRMTEKEGGDGMMVAAVRPYLLDLGSTNGTWLNGERLEAQRYYELMEKDMVKFGTSSREYVLLKES